MKCTGINKKEIKKQTDMKNVFLKTIILADAVMFLGM
jgi:hypothetical protein